MAKAHQQYFSDEVAIKKEALTFNFDQELLDKIINNPGEENIIEIVKVNGTPLVPDAQKAVDVPVPLVVDALDSTNPDSSLSARQGKILYDYILNLQSRGRFLSNWDAVNGVPVTTPFGSSYTYNAGDYYVVGIVAGSGGINLRPDDSTYYSGYHSGTAENETLDVSDMYVWDGSQWILTKNTARQIVVDQTLSTTSTNPVENRVITNALNTKQPLLAAGAHVYIDQNTWTISADDTTYPNLPASQGGVDDTLVTTGDKYNWDAKQDGLQAGANIQIVGNVISATDTVYNSLSPSQGGNDVSLVTTGEKYTWNNKQDRLEAGDNIQIVGNRISATDTVYTGGEGINVNPTTKVISSTVTPGIWGSITGDINSQTDLQNVLSGKQDLLTAGDNIEIVGNRISATNTTYGEGSWISITNGNINNEAPFTPEYPGEEGQVLTKTATGYRWMDGGGSGGASVSNTNFGPSWDGVIDVAPSKNVVYDKISSMDTIISGKQDRLEAGDNIQIDGITISATDTKYQASDFDIKDLADSTGLRNIWNNKQDAIDDLPAIRTGAALGATALQPGDNVSELVNDAGYITKAVNDLINYYTKNQVYTKTEVDNLIGNITGFEVVPTLPTTNIKTNVIYLVGPVNNVYEEYVRSNNQWIHIGQISSTMDLTNYFNKITDDSDDITEGDSHLFMTPSERLNLSNQSGVNTGDETKTTIQNKLGAASSTKSGYLTSTDWNTFNNKQDKLIAGDNITISGNTISATCDCGTEYTAGTGIKISGDVISNTKPFNPSNSGSTGQVLTKTSGGYRWEDDGGSSGGVTSVNGQTGNVYIDEFSPDNSGSAGNVLVKTSRGYEWGTVANMSNVKSRQIDSNNVSESTLIEILAWVATGGAQNNCAILKDTRTKDTFIYNRYTTSGGLKYRFIGQKRYSAAVTAPSSNNNGNYTKAWNNEFHIRSSGGHYYAEVVETDDNESRTNYISAMPQGYGYTQWFKPTDDFQPATKGYVDAAVAAGPSGVGGITSYQVGTDKTITKEWVGTQAQYDSMSSHPDGIIYNIISSS